MLHWWYTLTAPPEPAPDAPFLLRELGRRSRLTSTISFGFIIAEIVLLLAGLHDPSFAGLIDGRSGFFFLPFAFILTLVATALNRYGVINAAGVILAIVAETPILVLMFFPANGKLTIADIPIYYMLVISELVVVSILPPASVFGVVLLNTALIVGDLLLQPGNGAISALLRQSDDTLTTLALPIALQVIVALVAYVWVGNTLQALRRADRAEEIATLERREAERTRELEEGVRQLLETHVQLSNGNFNIRAPAVRNQQLWHIGNSLNTLIARLGRLSQDSFTLQREREEARRLAEAINASRNGRYQVWPAPTGVPLDEVLAALNPRQPTPGAPPIVSPGSGLSPAPASQSTSAAPFATPDYPSLYATPQPNPPNQPNQLTPLGSPFAAASFGGQSGAASSADPRGARDTRPVASDDWNSASYPLPTQARQPFQPAQPPAADAPAPNPPGQQRDWPEWTE